MVTQKCATCRKNASGHRQERSFPARPPSPPRPETPSRSPTAPHPLPRPPPAPGRRGHGFPRSHGPAEDEVKAEWLTLRCPADPPGPAGPIRATSEAATPKARGNRGETAGHARARRVGSLPTVRACCPETPNEPERRGNPRDFFREDGEDERAEGAKGWPPRPSAAPPRKDAGEHRTNPKAAGTLGKFLQQRARRARRQPEPPGAMVRNLLR